jgi:hypothetical protein
VDYSRLSNSQIQAAGRAGGLGRWLGSCIAADSIKFGCARAFSLLI